MTDTAVVKHNYKLDTPLKMKVLAMMARGEKYGTIRRVLKDDHNIDYSDSSLVTLRKNNIDTVREMEGMILDAEVAESEKIRNKALRQLNRKLDQAHEDGLEIARLDEEYRTTEMTLSEYRRKKAGLLKVSVKELVEVSREMHAQVGRGKSGSASGALPQGNNGEAGAGADPKWVEALMAAVQRGDTIAMQQLIINPSA